MVIKNLENKIKLVTIVCCVFLAGCVVISMSSIWTARSMVADAQKKIYVLDGTVPVLVERTTMDETLDVEAKSHVERFHHLFFTLAPDDKYIKYTMDKAMYLVDETGLAQYNTHKREASTTTSWVRRLYSRFTVIQSTSTRRRWSSNTMAVSASSDVPLSLPVNW